MNKHILKIKELVSELHCMGTYGLVELELNELEKLIESKESINNNDCIADVSNCTLSKECLDKWMWKYAKEVQDADNIIGLHVDTNFRGWLADNLMNEYYC